MPFEKTSRYTVYRLSVAEAMEMLRARIAADPRESARPISFYFNDEFSFGFGPHLASSVGGSARSTETPAPPSERATKEPLRGDVLLRDLETIENPLARQKALRERALYLGNSNSGLWTELATLVGNEFHDVRRLAASAMKKRLDRDASVGKYFIRPLAEALVAETYPQVRKLKESVHRHWCHRCKRPITKEESAAGLAKYGKPYCRRCFDERALEDVDFERNVELAKGRRTLDGVAVQSIGEKRIGSWLAAHGIAYEYDARYRIVEDTVLRPDFYLREFDLYIEYWGMNTDRYNANRKLSFHVPGLVR